MVGGQQRASEPAQANRTIQRPEIEKLETFTSLYKSNKVIGRLTYQPSYSTFSSKRIGHMANLYKTLPSRIFPHLGRHAEQAVIRH